MYSSVVILNVGALGVMEGGVGIGGHGRGGTCAYLFMQMLWRSKLLLLQSKLPQNRLQW